MRYLVYLMILANLAFFHWYPRSTVRAYHIDVSNLPPIPPRVQQLVLLQERPVAGQQNRESTKSPADNKETSPDPSVGAIQEDDEPAVSVPPPQEQLVAQPVASCHTVGPLPSLPEVQALRVQLREFGLEPKPRSSDVRAQIGYWVYLPAMPADEAKLIAEDLRQSGITDYFIGRQSYIALGTFTDKRTAENRRRQIEKMGYSPRLDPRFRTRTVYWLDFEVKGAELLASEAWLDLEEKYADARRQVIECE